MYEYIFVYIVLSFLQLLIFLSDFFFPYFFHDHLNILDQVVSSERAIFGTPVCTRI
jgi:hypothetical protein